MLYVQLSIELQAPVLCSDKVWKWYSVLQISRGLEPGSLPPFIHFMNGRSTEGESLGDFGHTLDIDEVSWTWL